MHYEVTLNGRVLAQFAALSDARDYAEKVGGLVRAISEYHWFIGD